MIRSSLVRSMVAASALVAASAAPAAAQNARSWVSGTGLDTNICSRTNPCRTFEGALSKTAAGGEIDALDPADFQPVLITKAITIDGGAGVAAVILSSPSIGISINAG